MGFSHDDIICGNSNGNIRLKYNALVVRTVEGRNGINANVRVIWAGVYPDL